MFCQEGKLLRTYIAASLSFNAVAGLGSANHVGCWLFNGATAFYQLVRAGEWERHFEGELGRTINPARFATRSVTLKDASIVPNNMVPGRCAGSIPGLMRQCRFFPLLAILTGPQKAVCTAHEMVILVTQPAQV